jgi:hypothetical protein
MEGVPPLPAAGEGWVFPQSIFPVWSEPTRRFAPTSPATDPQAGEVKQPAAESIQPNAILLWAGGVAPRLN